MKTTFKKSFVKDLKTHDNDKNLLTRIQETILEVEAADSITSIKNLKKLKAEGSYYRIRVGNYRLGLRSVQPITYKEWLRERFDRFKDRSQLILIPPSMAFRESDNPR